MAFYDKFPYTNFQEINLDRLIQELIQVKEGLNFVIENASLKYADPIQWNITTQYQANTVVIDPAKDIAYISTKPVPNNVQITDTNYWTPIFDLSKMFDDLETAVQALQTAVRTINTDLAAETTARTEADRALNTAITNETYARISAIDTMKAHTGFVNVLDFGAVGDGVTDDTAAFKSAIKHCITNNVGLYVPAVGAWNQEGGYILSETLNIDYPMVFVCEPNALMNWKNARYHPSGTAGSGRNNATVFDYGYGINIDYGSFRGHKGFYKFGILQGDKSYYRSQKATEPSGEYWTAIRLANADLVQIDVQYISYWSCGFHITSTNSWTDNNYIKFNVMDDCKTGIQIWTTQNWPVENLEIRFNTIGICQYGIEIDGDGTFMNSDIDGMQIFTEYPDGYPISAWNNPLIQNVKFNINNLNNHNTQVTVIKTGNAATFNAPLIIGDNGDFNANDCIIECGMDNEGAADTDSVHLVSVNGYRNRIVNTHSLYTGNVSECIGLSTSGNLADFNNGQRIKTNYAYIDWVADRSYTAGETIMLYGHAALIEIGNDSTPLALTDLTLNTPIRAIALSNSTEYAKRFRVQIGVVSNFDSGYRFRFLLKIG